MNEDCYEFGYDYKRIASVMVYQGVCGKGDLDLSGVKSLMNEFGYDERNWT